MAWPKGVPRGPRGPYKKKDSNDPMAKKVKPVKVIATKSVDDVNNESEEIEDLESDVVIADTEEFWGFKISKRDYTVQRRFKYEEDQTLECTVAGELVTKHIKAGDWSEWKNEKGANGPYFSTLKQTINYIKNGMVKTELKEKKRLDVLIEALVRSENRVLKFTKGM